MGYTVDPTRAHDKQAGGLLATAIEMGYGTRDVTWDPASASYDAPAEVIDRFMDDQDDTEEDAPAQAPKRRGRRPKSADEKTEGDGADPNAGKE